MHRRAPLALAPFAIAVVLACLAGCSQPHSTAQAPPKAQPSPGAPAPKKPAPEVKEQSRPMHVGLSRPSYSWDDERGRHVWQAESRSASGEQVSGGGVVELRDVKATLFKDGKPASTLIAPFVRANSVTREVSASGGVVVITKSPEATVRADRMLWKARENKITGVGHVKMVRDGTTVAAESFEGDTELKTWSLHNGSMDAR